MDFNGPSAAIVNRAPVKRPVPVARPAINGISRLSAQTSRPTASGSAVPRATPVKSHSSSFSARSDASSSSAGRTLQTSKAASTKIITHKSKSNAGARSIASTASGSSTPLRRKRTPSPIRSDSDSDTASDSHASSTSSVASGKRKKLKTNGKHEHGNGHSGPAASAKVKDQGRIRDTDSPRSASSKPNGRTSATPTANGASTPSTKKAGIAKFKQGRELWCLGKVDRRGEWGMGWAGFTGCEEAIRGDVLGWNGGRGVGRGLGKYVAYFPQAGFEAPTSEKDKPPMVELLYPAKECRETFVLLVPPPNLAEYNPVAELKAVLTLILEHYIPPSHRAIFGTLETSLDMEEFKAVPTPSTAPSPLPSKGIDVLSESNPSTNDTNVSNHFLPSANGLSVPASAPSTPRTPIADPFSELATESIGTALRRALAPNRRNGPGLIAAIERYNVAMASLQESGEMQAYMEVRARELEYGKWSTLCERVNEMAYARVVGPYSHELEHHPKHPDEVAKVISGKEDSYGELRHNFMSNIISLTSLNPSSVFVDLGSGVGNCILQTALQAGCESYGVELLPVPSHCARLQIQEAKRRWAMWGLNGSQKVEVQEGDMRGNGVVAGWLSRADVVLVNNEVFSPSLNDDLKNMFLDLKEGAKIVSLKPFVHEGFKMNESNCDSFDAIVKLSKHKYYHSWVSWKGDMGEFFVQTIDRSARIKFEEDLVKGRGSRSSRR